MAFSGMINVKTGQLTLGGQFEAYKRGQLERNIHLILPFLLILCKYQQMRGSSFILNFLFIFFFFF